MHVSRPSGRHGPAMAYRCKDLLDVGRMSKWEMHSCTNGLQGRYRAFNMQGPDKTAPSTGNINAARKPEMALCNCKTSLLVLMLVGFVQLAGSDLICRIFIDSLHGIWFENPDTKKLTLDAQCTGYLYKNVKGVIGKRRGPCNPYLNYDMGIGGLCLAACNSSCTSPPCPRPTPKDPRYKARMCVPTDCLTSCTRGECSEEGKCIPRSCVDACTNGRCDQAGKCNCFTGFNRDRETRGCITSPCQKACINGVCDEYGECTCSQGFKQSPKSLYQCNEIECPSGVTEEDVFCKTRCDVRCMNGTCDSVGDCTCNAGFAKGSETLYECVQANRSVLQNEDCNAEGSCARGALVETVGGGLLVIYVAIILLVAVVRAVRSTTGKVLITNEDDLPGFEFFQDPARTMMTTPLQRCESFPDEYRISEETGGEAEEFPIYANLSEATARDPQYMNFLQARR